MTPEEITATLPPPTQEQIKMVEALGVPTPIEVAPAIDPAAPVFNEAAMLVQKYNSEFRIMETVLSLGQLAMTRKPEIRAGKAVVFVRSDTYNANSSLLFLTGKIVTGTDNPLIHTGNCSAIVNAGINRVLDILEVKSFFTPAWMAGVLHEPSLCKEPKRRKYNIESILGSTIIELARLAPMNPTLRSHLTAIFRTPPPLEADTFQKLKDWMEFEFDPPYLEGARKQWYGINQQAARPGVPAVDPARRPAFDIKVTLTGTQIGTCRYVANAVKETSTSILASNLTSWIRDGLTLDDIIANVADRAYSNVDANFETAEVTNHVYSDHVFEDVEGIKRSTDEEEIKTRVVDYIRRTYGPEEAQQVIDRE